MNETKRMINKASPTEPVIPGRGSYYLKVIYMYGAKSPFSRDFPLSNGREIREFPLTKGLESEKLP